MHEMEQKKEVDPEIIERGIELFWSDDVFSITDFSTTGARWPVYMPYDRTYAAFKALALGDEELTVENMALKNLVADKIAGSIPGIEEIENRRIEIANAKNKKVVKPPFDPEVLKRLQ